MRVYPVSFCFTLVVTENLMNRYQRIIIAVVVLNLLAFCIFPPFTNKPLAYGARPLFDGFFLSFTQQGFRQVYLELLAGQLLVVLGNAVVAWFALHFTRRDPFSNYRYGLWISIITLANLAIVLLFPPFTYYSSELQGALAGFDDFYFIFGSRSARPVYAPLLYIECYFVLINALVLYLLFNAVARYETAERQRLLMAANDMNDDELAKLSGAVRRMVDGHRAKTSHASLGRKKDRREKREVTYRGPERRVRKDRRGN